MHPLRNCISIITISTRMPNTKTKEQTIESAPIIIPQSTLTKFNADSFQVIRQNHLRDYPLILNQISSSIDQIKAKTRNYSLLL